MVDSVIPRNEGLTIGMGGNAITAPGTPHYEFHRSLEAFWDQYRPGGALERMRPINAEYGRAVERAFVASGFSPADASELARIASQERVARGLCETAKVLRIPARLNQASRMIAGVRVVGRVAGPAIVVCMVADPLISGVADRIIDSQFPGAFPFVDRNALATDVVLSVVDGLTFGVLLHENPHSPPGYTGADSALLQQGRPSGRTVSPAPDTSVNQEIARRNALLQRALRVMNGSP